MNECLSVLLVDVPNWIPMAVGAIALGAWGYLWYRADDRYVKRDAYKADMDRIMADAEKRDKRSEERSLALTTANASFQATINAQLEAMKTAEQSHHEAVRKSIHDASNNTNSQLLNVAEKIAQLGGQMSVLIGDRNKE